MKNLQSLKFLGMKYGNFKWSNFNRKIVNPNEKIAKELANKQVKIAVFLSKCSDRRFVQLVRDFLCGYGWEINQSWNTPPKFNVQNLFHFAILWQDLNSSDLDTCAMAELGWHFSKIHAMAMEYGFSIKEFNDIRNGFQNSFIANVCSVFRKKSELYSYANEFYRLLTAKPDKSNNTKTANRKT